MSFWPISWMYASHTHRFHLCCRLPPELEMTFRLILARSLFIIVCFTRNNQCTENSENKEHIDVLLFDQQPVLYSGKYPNFPRICTIFLPQLLDIFCLRCVDNTTRYESTVGVASRSSCASFTGHAGPFLPPFPPHMVWPVWCLRGNITYDN